MMIGHCRRTQPDFVLIEGVQLLQVAVALKEALPALPLIIDMHNVESRLRVEIDLKRLPRLLRALGGVVFGPRHRRCTEADRAAAALAHQVWVCSEDDAREVRNLLPGAKVSVVPNPIPQWAENFQLGTRNTEKAVLFVGHLGYAPNVSAARELSDEIMPRLRRFHSDAKLILCGRRARRRLARDMRKAGHDLLVDEPDLAPIYARAAVTAIPLREGSGTRLKVLEAMSVACPIVATEKAVEGLGLTRGVHYLNAETASDFARQLATVLSDPGAFRPMTMAARQLANEAFGAEARRRSVVTALTEAGLVTDG